MIRCPHCGHEMHVKGLRAGVFTPRCPRCSKKFSITLESDTAEPVVSAQVQAGAAATMPGAARSARGNQTLAPEGPAEGTEKARPGVEDLRPGTVPPPMAQKASPDEFVVREPPKVYQQSIGQLAPRRAATVTGFRTGKLGGYELKRKLGQGGMGTVYLARQVSLDRDVAVKVLAGDLAEDAQFVSRFVREAYAAAQLVHHNVVQIHDIGEEERTHFYSMEFVKGQSLADVIRTEGAIAADTAAGYILQAARGLKIAHDQGMIHRDIKPENLLLSQDGIVKVADLGLVKRQGEVEQPGAGRGVPAEGEATSTQTIAKSTMGTPAYMAPEQAEDAAKVDARADIYSLGCTLCALLTGHPPFEAETPEKVLRKAKTGEVPAPKTVNESVPSELSRITKMMTSKRKEDRYANIGLVIHELEQYLGLEGTGLFSPRKQHVEELEECVKQFNDSSMAAIRRALIRLFVIGGLLAAGLLIWRGKWSWAIAIIAMLIATSVFYHAIASLTGGSHLAIRVRQLAFHSSWRDWLRWVAMLVLGIIATLALDLMGPAVVLGVVALILAVLFRFTVDKMLAAQRHHAMSRAEDLFRGFRLKGLDEDSVRRFACEYAGSGWEEFFETMFGYEAKMEARQRWSRSGRGYNRPKYAAWRDPIIRWIDHREEVIRQEKERKHLLRIETKALQAQGVEAVAAAKQAKRMAEMMMAQALDLKERTLRGRDEPAPTLPPGNEPAVQRAREPFRFDAEGERAGYRKTSYIERRYGGPMDILFGTRMRFALAALILLGFLLWRYDNRAAIVNEVVSLRGQRIEPVLQDPTKAIDTRKLVEVAAYTAKPLRMPGVPDVLCDAAGSWNGGVAGAILLIGSFMRRVKVGIPLMVAAGIALFGQHLPIMGQLPFGDPQTVSLLIGAAIGMVTFAVMKRGDA